MVQVNQHRRQKYQVDSFPILSKAYKSNHERKTNMQEIVYKGLHDILCILSQNVLIAIQSINILKSKQLEPSHMSEKTQWLIYHFLKVVNGLYSGIPDARSASFEIVGTRSTTK